MPKRVVCEERVLVSVEQIHQAILNSLEENPDFICEVFSTYWCNKKTKWELNPDTTKAIFTITGTEGQIKKVLSTLTDNGINCKSNCGGGE